MVKQIWIEDELHKRIKSRAASKGLLMKTYLENLVTEDEIRRLKE